MLKERKENRLIYLDYLRIMATIGIVILHVAAENFFKKPVNSFEWNVFNVYDGMVRWGVPVFAMISGALFLDNTRSLSIKKLYTKNILRIITAFAFWSLLYAIIDPDKRLYVNGMGKIHYIVRNFVTGHLHMWFLFMIVGMYMIVPILRKITESEKIMEYFLLLSLIFSFLIPTILKIPAMSYANTVYGKVVFHFTLGYSCYFVLGAYLNKKEFHRGWQYIMYMIGILGFVGTIILTAVLSQNSNKVVTDYTYEYFTITVLMEAIGVFAFAKYKLQNIKISEKIRKRVVQISKYSFGVYLVHLLIVEKLPLHGVDTLMCNPFVSVPLKVVIVFILSILISAILNHVPILKKYIV